jgi:TetR/AcrR family transcriptional regulator, transcriptional repressor for nem operon
MSDTQQRIVVTAIELFLSEGFEGAATADICKKAHVKKGSLYHFFPSKHQLLTAALNDYARPITSKFADIAQSSESIESGVVELCAIPLAANTEWKKKTDRVLGCLVGNMASSIAAPHAAAFFGFGRRRMQCDAALGRATSRCDPDGKTP